MKKVNVVLASTDRHYVELFMHFVHTSEFSGKFHIKSFTQLESFRFVVQNDLETDLIAAEPDFLNATGVQFPSCPVIALTEHDIEQYENAEFSVRKYQPLQLLLSSFLSIHAMERQGRTSQTSAHHSAKARILSVYSAVSGIGKTTVALNLIKQLAMQGKRVFYLNLETINSTGLWMQQSSAAADHRMSRLLYWIKGHRPVEELLTEWGQFKAYHPQMKVDYFEPIGNLDEMKQMTKEDVFRLLDLLQSLRCYDTILVDLESTFHERVQAALERSDRVIWLLHNDLLSLHKTEIWFFYLEQMHGHQAQAIRGKTRFVMNRHMGGITDLGGKSDIQISGYLPYVSGWKQLQRPDELLQDAAFQADVLKILAEEAALSWVQEVTV